MTYSVFISKSAKKELKQIPVQYYVSIMEHIIALAEEPFPLGSKKLKNAQNIYRIRVGVYRIIYTVNNNELIIDVIKIGHRKDVYDN